MCAISSTAILIPARFESSRFPGKPLIKICGISLLERTYRRAQKCKNISKIIVVTDDLRIQDHAHSFGAEVIMTSQDCSTGTDRIAQAVQLHPALQQFDCIVNVQGDEPCISVETIEGVANILQTYSSTDIATAVCPLYNEADLSSPNIVKCVLSKSNRVLYFSRLPIPGNKKQLPSIHENSSVPYYKHIGIYGFRPHTLLRLSRLKETPLQKEEDMEALRALENDMIIRAITVKTHAPGVDTPSDIDIVQAWLMQENNEVEEETV